MAFNSKYHAYFYDRNGDYIFIDIKQKDFAGTSEHLSLLESNPLTISFPKKEFNNEIFGSGCKINIINDSENFFKFDDLFSFPERSNYVVITKDSSNLSDKITLFEGYILPEMYTTTLEKNIRLTIPVTDQLAKLEDSTPAIIIDTSTYRSPEFVNSFDIIYQSLYNTDITDKVAIVNTLSNINYTPDTSSTVFDNLFVDVNNFGDRDNINSAKTIIEKILRPLYSRLYYYNGRWNIERVKDLGTADKMYIISDTSTVTSEVVANPPVVLSNHDIISKSPALTYFPGFQKLNLKLNYKQPETLVNNYYWDFEYYNKVDISTNSLLPLPNGRNWMLSGTDGSLNAWAYEDANLSTGLAFTLGDWFPINTAKWSWLGDQFATASFRYNKNPDVTDINVSYEYSLTGGEGVSGHTFKTGFSLRALDENGDDIWLARSGSTDSSTYWSSSRYIFENSTSFDDIEGNLIKVSDTIRVSNFLESTYRWKSGGWAWLWLKKWETGTVFVPMDEEIIGEIFLDIYALRRNTLSVPGTYYGLRTNFGNVKVTIPAAIPPDIVEGELDVFSSIKTISLDVFDISTATFTNGVYNANDDLEFRLIHRWRDSLLEEWKKLQYQYLEDVAQMYASPRYGLSLDVRSKDSSMWSLGMIYEHKDLRYPDDSSVRFLCNGFDYNVIENTYRLELTEYIPDGSWRIGEPIDPSFNIAPTYHYFNWNDESVKTSTAVTNVEWSADTSDNWINLSKVGDVLSIDVSTNTGEASRNGTITVTPTQGLSTRTINVSQGAEDMDGYFGFTNDGTLQVDTLRPDQVISVTLKVTASAHVQSNFGDLYNNTAWVDYVGDTSSFQVLADIQDCDTTCDDVSTRQIALTDIDASSSISLMGALGDFIDDAGGYVDSSVWCEIVSFEHTAGDGSVHQMNEGWRMYWDDGLDRMESYGDIDPI